MRLVLASSSPRRAALLRQICLDFEVDPPQINEDIDGSSGPLELVQRIATAKAEEVARRHATTATIVLAADTIIVVAGRVYGRPRDTMEAKRMLATLRGRTHTAVTGYTLVNCADMQRLVRVASTAVTMRAFSDDELAGYLSSREALDAAGAYAIQGLGALLVQSISGDYYTVVGLPLSEVAQALARFGIHCLSGEAVDTGREQ